MVLVAPTHGPEVRDGGYGEADAAFPAVAGEYDGTTNVGTTNVAPTNVAPTNVATTNVAPTALTVAAAEPFFSPDCGVANLGLSEVRHHHAYGAGCYQKPAEEIWGFFGRRGGRECRTQKNTEEHEEHVEV